MNTFEIIGLLVVLPAAIVGVLMLLTLGVGRHRTHIRYEVGKPWEHDDQLWGGTVPVISVPVDDRVGTTVGGARGTW